MTLKPLWDSAAHLDLGHNHDINIYRIAMFYRYKGVCAWSSDPIEPFLAEANQAI